MHDLLADSASLLVLAEGLDAVQIVSRIAHILGAIVLVGGVFYLRFVLFPVASNGQALDDATLADMRARWSMWVALTAVFLLASGFYNIVVRFQGSKLPPLYHMLFGAKFLLAFVVLFLSSILAGKTAAADRFRQKQGMWLNVNLAAAVAIVCLAAVLRFTPGEPKTDAAVSPAAQSAPAN